MESPTLSIFDWFLSKEKLKEKFRKEIEHTDMLRMYIVATRNTNKKYIFKHNGQLITSDDIEKEFNDDIKS